MTQELPKSIPVTGTDWFLHAFDHGMRGSGRPGNLCHLVLKFDRHLEPELIDRQLAQAHWLQWLASLRLDPGRGWTAPSWRVACEAAPLRVTRQTATLAEEITQALLSQRCDVHIDSPIRLFHFQGTDVDHVALTFHHAALDARGAELILRRLGGLLPEPTLTDLVTLPTPDSRPWYRRLLSAKRGRDFVLRISLGRLRFPAPRHLPAGETLRFRRIVFNEGETKRASEVARAQGALLGSAAFHLASVAHAMHRATGPRMKPHGAYLVPMPLDRRRRGSTGPILGNQISLLFYRLPIDSLDDLPNAVTHLIDQMKQRLRDKLPEAFETLLGMCRALPVGLLRAIVRLPTFGRLSSFGFSDTGATLEQLDRFLDHDVTDAWHHPGNMEPPGITVISSRHRNRLSFSLAWLQSALSDDEITTLVAELRHTLLTLPTDAETR